MIYNLNNDIEQQKAQERLTWLCSKKKRIEIKELRGKRTTPQNAYLHLLLSYFALEYGETLQYTKQFIFKEYVNGAIFKTTRKNPKSGKTRQSLKSSADLDTKEMTNAINVFKNWSASVVGIRLPEANEQEFLDHIQNEIDKNKQWL
jgi:hypothetical protein